MSIISKYANQAKNVSWYLGSSLIIALLGVAANPIFAKFLSYYDYSIIGYLTSFSSIYLALSHFCFYSYYARAYFFTDENKRESLCNTLLCGLLGVGAVIYVTFLLGLYIFWIKTNVSLPFFPFALLYFLQQSLANIISFYLVKLKVQRKAKAYAILSLTNGIVCLGLELVFVAALKMGALGKFTGLLLATSIIAIICFKRCLTKFEFDKGIFKNAFSFCYPLVFSSLLFYFFNGYDRFLLEKYNDTYQYGLYSVGLQMANYMSIMLTSMLNTFEPDIYQSIANKNLKRALKYIGLVIGVVGIMNLLFISFAPFIIGILTANRYVEASIYARIFAVANIATAGYYLVMRLFIAYGKTKYELLSRTLGAVSAVLIFNYMTSKYGFVGGAWGQVVALMFVTLVSVSILSLVVKK